jgi:hypothetical protein
MPAKFTDPQTSRLIRCLRWAFGMSCTGLAISMTLSWDDPGLPPMLGPILVLAFFVCAASSVAGLAAVRIKHSRK